MGDPGLLHIVITDFNGWQQTRTCLRALQNSSYSNFRAIVVDHGTSPETASGLLEYSWAVHLRAEPDLWWAGATNRGVREAMNRDARYVMLLNNDCYVDPSTLEELMRHVSDGELRVVAPVQSDAATGKILVARAGTCFSLGFPTLVLPGMRTLPQTGDALMPTRLIIGGRGVVMRTEVFDEVGLFDERELPHYGADHDFFMRCRRHSVPLLIAANANVNIDSERSTLANNLGAMNWGEFKDSLHEPRSHRNIDALSTLFKRYYPIKALSRLGVWLNLGRYFLSYVVQRAAFVLWRSG